MRSKPRSFAARCIQKHQILRSLLFCHGLENQASGDRVRSVQRLRGHPETIGILKDSGHALRESEKQTLVRLLGQQSYLLRLHVVELRLG